MSYAPVRSVAALIALAILCQPESSLASVSWSDIHCSGYGYHTEQGPPEEHPTSSIDLCHGQTGDSGGCSVPSTFFSAGVTCTVTPGGRTSCMATLSCNVGGKSYTCGGFGAEVFVGGQDQGDGSTAGFIKCIKADGSVFQETCPTGVA